MGQASLSGLCLPYCDERIATTVTARQNEFERVAMPHSRSLLRVARRLASDPAAAEDLVQETYFRAWRSFNQFQTGTNIRAWLFRIMFNAFYAHGRQISAAPILVSLDAPGRDTEPQSQSGASLAEIAEITQLEVTAVKSRLQRARATLRETLGAYSPRTERII